MRRLRLLPITFGPSYEVAPTPGTKAAATCTVVVAAVVLVAVAVAVVRWPWVAMLAGAVAAFTWGRKHYGGDAIIVGIVLLVAGLSLLR